MSTLTGPIEEHDWPDKLTAHVVTPDAKRIHGYDVESDLARHYSFAETVYLCLTGELPDEQTGHAFGTLLTLLSPITAAEAAVHAGIVARLQRATPSSVSGVVSLGLGEHAAESLRELEPLLDWLDAGRTGDLEPAYRAKDDVERARVVDVLATAGLPEGLGADLGYQPALIAALHDLGLRSTEQILACLVLSRLPAAVSEALAVEPGSVQNYPMRLPEFVYEEEQP